MTVRIAAIADIHSPRYLSEFRSALEDCRDPDIFLLAGDMIDSGRADEYGHISDAIRSQFGELLPVVACFGNDEQRADTRAIRSIVGSSIVFLDGETTIIPLRGRSIGVLGVPLLDASSCSQDRTLQDIFEERIQSLARSLEQIGRICDYTVLLMHYSPLSTEAYPDSFSWWMSHAFKQIQPDLIIHGHIHYETRPLTTIDATKVVNVAFPATRKITELEL
jgi:Icc-related predicted phosphoesterase